MHTTHTHINGNRPALNAQATISAALALNARTVGVVALGSKRGLPAAWALPMLDAGQAGAYSLLDGHSAHSFNTGARV